MARAEAAPNVGPAAPPPPTTPGAAQAPAVPAAADASKANAKVDPKMSKSAGPTNRAPVLIYEGSIAMQTDAGQITKTIDSIIDLAEQSGGFLVARKDDSVQVRVPSTSFRPTLAKLEDMGIVTERSVKADDVSEEFHDLEVQLTNLKATRTRLQELLGRAGGVADMLVVEKELERVALEIDRIEGRLTFLRTRAAMSLVSVKLTAKQAPIARSSAPPRPVELPQPWANAVGVDSLLKIQK